MNKEGRLFQTKMNKGTEMTKAGRFYQTEINKFPEMNKGGATISDKNEQKARDEQRFVAL